MLDRFANSSVTVPSFLIVSAIGFSSLWFSPAILSISSVLLIVISLTGAKDLLTKNMLPLALSMFFILLLYVADVFRGENPSTAWAKLSLFIGFIGVQLACFMTFKKAKEHLTLLFLVFSVIVLIINIIAVSNYLLNKEYFDEMLLQSKHIPILRMHHIHFGILNAIFILGLAGLVYLKKVTGLQKKLTIAMLLLITIACHILSSRTGLISLYSGVLMVLLVLVFKHKSLKLLFAGLFSIAIIIGSAYFISTSFRSKIANSLEDFRSWDQGEEINYKSMAMRVEAYKTSAYVLSEHAFGVGAEAQEAAMQEAYTARNTVLFKQNRVGPHNQFLEYGVKFGWLGILFLFFYFASVFRMSLATDFPYLGIVVIIFVSTQFESLLERQASIFFISVLLPLCYHLFIKDKINGATVT